MWTGLIWHVATALVSTNMSLQVQVLARALLGDLLASEKGI
jgi:hypothetical protein